MSLLELFSACFPCLPDLSKPELRINKAKFKILKLLGEGGFSYVYLVQASNGGQYALKKIRCPFGNENVKLATKEINNYKEFKSPYIIRSIDESIVQEVDGSKTVYILLPFFERSLQDIINYNILNDKVMREDEVLKVFIGICRGLQVMHKHHKSGPSRVDTNSNEDNEDDTLLSSDNDTDDLQTNLSLNLDSTGQSTELQETVPFAHRDLKPGNVMLSNDGIPVLCDLGSTSRARANVSTRSQALALQEMAAEHCTLPYRAPELLDVKTGAKITESTDIWSLGCTVYAMLYGSSPFERAEADSGANVSLAISGGNYQIPGTPAYSDELKQIIKECVNLDPEARPTIDEVLSRALDIQSRSTR